VRLLRRLAVGTPANDRFESCTWGNASSAAVITFPQRDWGQDCMMRRSLRGAGHAATSSRGEFAGTSKGSAGVLSWKRFTEGKADSLKVVESVAGSP